MQHDGETRPDGYLGDTVEVRGGGYIKNFGRERVPEGCRKKAVLLSAWGKGGYNLQIQVYCAEKGVN